ncbi:Domain of unknown function DUF1638 [Acididesulfobacillus acetoxydans]|uniref:DUF1638 domain-containing protein n=1 Tax=Acididesulfobacillus acetoxydans TaxID=1561005 RepID=A0A8S0Y368_9FIRM|nr:DUF1638 domain-containing protein [Acididesulfobacillus acetoxydans]CAA7601695.1 Domain of unknown function DUF1638 [Acididesulfobacillus acetoxydans]CEJ09086.1 Protein of unknown function (DUF1638) [Acididesulfobacillus acetoxydans]
MAALSFKDYAIVACGTLIPELNYLKDNGFLDAKIIYTAPGLHQVPEELEKQLQKQLEAAKKLAKKIIVVYGGKYCYINIRDPLRTIDKVIDEMREEGFYISRTDVENCVDMLADGEQRDAIADGQKVWFCTAGWLKYRDQVFKGWDKANANENFPQYTGGGILLDPIGFFDEYALEHVEEILDFSDWASIPLEGRAVGLERLKKVLISAMAEEDRPADG